MKNIVLKSLGFLIVIAVIMTLLCSCQNAEVGDLSSADTTDSSDTGLTSDKTPSDEYKTIDLSELPPGTHKTLTVEDINRIIDESFELYRSYDEITVTTYLNNRKITFQPVRDFSDESNVDVFVFHITYIAFSKICSFVDSSMYCESQPDYSVSINPFWSACFIENYDEIPEPSLSEWLKDDSYTVPKDDFLDGANYFYFHTNHIYYYEVGVGEVEIWHGQKYLDYFNDFAYISKKCF